MLGVTHEEAVVTLHCVGDELVAIVCDGFDPALMEDQTASGVSPMARIESVSSIDKDFEFLPPSKRPDRQSKVREEQTWQNKSSQEEVPELKERSAPPKERSMPCPTTATSQFDTSTAPLSSLR